MKTLLVTIVACGALLSACSSSSPDVDPSSADAAPAEKTYPETCSHETLEADAKLSPFDGAGAKDGALVPSNADFAIAATYLQLRGSPDAAKKFQETMAKINQELAKAEGLVAFRVATSDSCGSARTLSVFKDETAMLKFVTSAAHSQAMTLATSLSRGKSKTTRWTGKLTEVTFEAGAQHLVTKPGGGF
ncbi:MAG: hypothetical protein JNM74_14000 [Myxococcales bacterium]|nr:hypothetical protein [Myxococcales bacterium]